MVATLGIVRCRAGSAAGVLWKRLKQPHFAKPICLGRFSQAPGRCCQRGARGPAGRERVWSSPSIPSPPSAKFRLPAHFWPQTKSSRWGSQPKTLALCLKERLFGRKQIPLFKISFRNAICSKILPGKVFWAAWPRSHVPPAAAAGRSQMQTLNPSLSTQPKSHWKGAIL